MDLNSSNRGCARLGGEVDPPLGVVVEEVAVLVVLVRWHRRAVRAAVRRAVDDDFDHFTSTAAAVVVTNLARGREGGGLELELIQPYMAQKPVLRGEVGCACVARVDRFEPTPQVLK